MAVTMSLPELLGRLARPIEFAARDNYAHLATIKDLGPFVSGQIVKALTDTIYLPDTEAHLLALRHLFADFNDTLPLEERRRRLQTARSLLSELQHPTATPPSTAAASARPAAPARPIEELWNLPIQYAKGIGPKRAALLQRLGVATIEQALWYLPWRYEDRSVITPINTITPGQHATISGTVAKVTLKRIPRRRLTIVEVRIDDDTGTLHAVFFNQPYLEDVLKPGTRAMVSGRVTAGPKGWADLRIEPEQYEVLDGETDATVHVGRIVPIYHETRGLTSRQLRAMIKGLLDHYLTAVPELLPETLRRTLRLPSIQPALAAVHFPPPEADPNQLERGTTPAHRRLAFEELFMLELALALRQAKVKQEIKGIRFNPRTPLLDRLRRRLPFTLTAAQERVLAEIQRDMASSHPMHRLLQGDVGSGKTVIGLAAMLIACGSGYQAALMAPTEILAEQHALTLRAWLEALGLRAALLTSGSKTKARKETLKQLASGELQIAIGTHALLQSDVRFAKLGLVVIDEQHKFGVLQRKTLLEKGYRPDVLVVTATPIPRTLAMTAYGDLDLSVIDALPPGRRPIRTFLYPEAQRGRAYQLLTDELRAGRQAYIVYPLVEESEKVDLQAAIQAAERLANRELKGFRVGLLHGRLKSTEKERTMAAFKSGALHVLVSTTVIEVGVDVPNATVMVIE
ncbi:MAG TPA: ATP-dependent DNA helicase RecG, partial [Nitrospirales bacterium]|nr:ATP-dependent DNA helicase RecG [Nitrospirales bacterium]